MKVSLMTLGTETEWGMIVAVTFTGERYYFIVDAQGTVTMMPASTIEPDAREGR